MPTLDEYIIHIDGDSFFVAVELTRRPDLWGKPVVTGGERGIASAMSKEAKKLGVTRAMPVFKIKKEFPEVVILPSDFTLYQMYSDRMAKIVMRYTDEVERYSIDECFARVRADGVTISEILRNIQEDVDTELGISVSLGAAANKTVAKLASNDSKPHGIRVIPIGGECSFVQNMPISAVWGIGRATQKKLAMYKIQTVADILNRPYEWYGERFAKPFLDTYTELAGVRMFTVCGVSVSKQSIANTRSFPSFLTEYTDILSEVSRNIELACSKLRHDGLRTKRIHFFLRRKDFTYISDGILLGSSTQDAGYVFECVEKKLKKMWVPDVYRSAGVTLYDLESVGNLQLSLFGETREENKRKTISSDVDNLVAHMGHQSIVLASSLSSHLRYRNAYNNSRKSEILHTSLEAFRTRKYIYLPYMGRVI